MPNESHVHVAGVAGVGMNPLAQALALRGFRVTGSDRFLDAGRRLPVLDKLARLGIGLTPQDGSALSPETRALVVSTAIESDNPEILRARELGIPVRHRAEMLADLARPGPCIAVAGTSGKTTTTAMLAYLLDAAGIPCNFVNGGAVVNWVDDHQIGNVRLAAPEAPWILEVDESDRSLLAFHPAHACITTVTADHFGLEETIDLFRKFRDQVAGEVLCGPGAAARLDPRLARPDDAPELRPAETGFEAVCGSRKLHCPLPGRHNAQNAWLAARLAERLGVPFERSAVHLAGFRGVERRLERVNPGHTPPVYDDYAHNPEKIAAAIGAVQDLAASVDVVWRPHGFGPLRALREALREMFAAQLRPADRLILLPVFDAGGTARRDVRSEDLAEDLRAEGVCAEVLEPEAAERLAGAPGRRDAVLVMGARDPGLPLLARGIAAAQGR